MGVTYDDNVARSNAVAAAFRGIEQEDVIYNPSVTVDIVQPFGRQAAFLSGSVGYDFYDKNDQLNRERIDLSGGVSSSLGPCRPTLGGSYKRQQSELDDLSLVVTENVETTTAVNLDVSCGRKVGFAPTLSLSQEWADNSAAVREIANYTTEAAAIGLGYIRPTFGELSVIGTVVRTKYDRLVPVAAGFERDGYDLYGGGVRYVRKLGARLQGTVSAGYTKVQPFTSIADDFEGFTYAADLTFRPSSRIDAKASFERAVNPSNAIGANYEVEEVYRLEASYLIGTRIRLSAGGSFSDTEYGGAALINGVAINDQRTRSFFGSARFTFSDRLSVVLDASQQERDANVHGADYTANRAGITISATY